MGKNYRTPWARLRCPQEMPKAVRMLYRLFPSMLILHFALTIR